jgi:hypothetical protein
MLKNCLRWFMVRQAHHERNLSSHIHERYSAPLVLSRSKDGHLPDLVVPDGA